VGDGRPPGRARRWYRSITARVTAGAVAVVALTLLIDSVGIVVALDRILEDGVALTLEQDLEGLSTRYDTAGLSVSEVEQIDDDERLIRLQGSVSAINDVDAAFMPTPPEQTTVRVDIDSEPYPVSAYRLEEDLTLVVGRSLEQAVNAVNATSITLSVALSIALLLIAFVIWVVIRRALAPVERMRRQVAAIDESGLDQRVPATGVGDELDRLAGTLNGMLDRLEQSQSAQRRFVSDASHELRSPLATMRQHAELVRHHPTAVAPGEFADIVLGEAERMQHLVEDLLLLARLDEGRGAMRPGPVDLDDLALAEVRRLRAVDPVTIDGSGIVAARVTGSEPLLARALRNLVDNARRHASSRVAITIEPGGDVVAVHVDDDGFGIPFVDRERVFERFARRDDARARDDGGSGLGLAIVREVAATHGGRAVAADSPLGGARFTLTIPRSLGR
jgi:signal transduction histidine kinase